MYEVKKNENTILYYPTIKIEDGVWLRNALLYWDKISSIVPETNYDETNSIEIEYLKSVGLYEPIYPSEMWGDEDLCRKFCEKVKKNIKHNNKEIKLNSRVHTDKMGMSEKNRVHIDKTPSIILDYLLDEGIAKRNCDGSWINMNEYASNVYMATLARYLAKIHGNTEIGTDKRNQFLSPFSYSKKCNKNKIDRQIFLDISLQNILPVPNLECPLEDIIDFKNQYKNELKCFKRRINQFQERLETCNDIEELQNRICAFQSEIENDLEEIDELMQEKKIRKTRNAVRALIPIGIDATISWLGVKGIISPQTVVKTNFAVDFAARLFCEKKEGQLDKEKAYMFYACQKNIIVPYHTGRN